jgi:hypothetical protein
MASNQSNTFPGGAEGRSRSAARDWPITKARRFPMPAGPYRGHTVADLLQSREGRRHLIWCARYLHGGSQVAAMVALAIPRPGDGEVRP